MKRNLIIVNVLLLGVVCLLAWIVRRKWNDELAQEHKVKTAVVRPPAVPQPPPLKKVAPIDGPSYAEIATKNLFSKDRNPQPIPDPPKPPPPPKPMPPLPVAHGVMMWGDLPPTVVLSEYGKSDQRSYHPGDKIGEFKVVSVSNKEVVFDWNGKQVSKSLEELMRAAIEANARAAASQAAVAAAGRGANGAGGNGSAATTASNAESGGTKSLSDADKGGSNEGPGKEVGGGIHVCIAGDNSPPGTVVNGLKKLVNTTPFGVTCRWEPVQ